MYYFIVLALFIIIFVFAGHFSSGFTCTGSFSVGDKVSRDCTIEHSSDKADVFNKSCGPKAPTNVLCSLASESQSKGVVVKWQNVGSDAKAYQLDVLDMSTFIPLKTTVIVRCSNSSNPLTSFHVFCNSSTTMNDNMAIFLYSLPTRPGCRDCFMCSNNHIDVTGDICSNTALFKKEEDKLILSSHQFSTIQTSTFYQTAEPDIKNNYQFSKTADYLIAAVVVFLIVLITFAMVLIYHFRKRTMKWIVEIPQQLLLPWRRQRENRNSEAMEIHKTNKGTPSISVVDDTRVSSDGRSNTTAQSISMKKSFDRGKSYDNDIKQKSSRPNLEISIKTRTNSALFPSACSQRNSVFTDRDGASSCVSCPVHRSSKTYGQGTNEDDIVEAMLRINFGAES